MLLGGSGVRVGEGVHFVDESAGAGVGLHLPAESLGGGGDVGVGDETMEVPVKAT